MTMVRLAKLRGATFSMLAALAFGSAIPAPAQVTPVDPDKAIDGDISQPASPATPAPAPATDPVTLPAQTPAQDGAPAPAEAPPPAQPAAASNTYKQDDLIGAAEGVFGKGSHGLAMMIEDILKKQGEPNGYITGREASGAIGVGLRYGSGTLHHKVEGDRPVYWTGPSLGFDLGANAANAFVLVYNLYNTDDLYRRFPAGEGQAYLVGGFHVSYLRRGDIVLIPVRMGAGLRLGVNAGYMKFSQKQRWLPF